MELFITYVELQRLIEAKTGRKLCLSQDEDATLRVKYTLDIPVPVLGNIQKEISANFSINRIIGNDLYITYSLAKGLDMMLAGVRTFLGGIIENTGMISWGDEERQIIIHADHVAEYAGVKNFSRIRQHVDAPMLSVKENGLQLSFEVRI